MWRRMWKAWSFVIPGTGSWKKSLIKSSPNSSNFSIAKPQCSAPSFWAPSGPAPFRTNRRQLGNYRGRAGFAAGPAGTWSWKSATWKAGCVKLGRAQLFGGRRVRRGPATIAAVTRRQSTASGGCRELRASAACSKTLPAQKPYFLASQNRREFAWRKVRLARLKNN